MGRFYGEIGYSIPTETSPGVWNNDIITTRNYFGDVLQNMVKNQSTENLNDDINIDNQISIVADPFAYQNFSNMKYVVWMRTKWKIKSVKVSAPRLILTIGGVYNEQTTTIA